MLLRVLTIILVLFCFSFNSLAEKKLHKGKYLWWRNPDICSQLELSEDQKVRIESIFQKYKVEIMEVHKELEVMQIELRDAMLDPSSPRKEVRELTEEVEKIRNHGHMIKVDMMLDIRDELTMDQRIKLKEIKKTYRNKNPKKIKYNEKGIFLLFST